MFPTDANKIKFSDGTEREIRFSLRTFQILKKKYGYSFLTGEGWNKVDEDSLPEIIYQALVDKTDITADDIADLISGDAIPVVMQAIAASLGSKTDQDDSKKKTELQ
jgi:hypothetical protein